jgi:hypothetical protein
MSKARDIVETLRTVLVDGDVTNANFTGADLDIAKGGTGASTAGAARTALGLAIGTDVLAPDGNGSALTGVDSLPSQTSQTGKFLTTNGSAASWGEVGGAGWTLLSTVNMAGASTANVETTFNSTYDYYHIVGTGIKVTTSLDIECRLKVNGSYDNQWNYRYHLIRMRSNSSSITNAKSSGYTAIPIDSMIGTNTDADAVCHFTMDVFNPTDSVANHMVSFDTLHSESSHMSRFSGMGGFNPATGTLTGVRFLTTGTSFSAGTLKLYGIKKA